MNVSFNKANNSLVCVNQSTCGVPHMTSDLLPSGRWSCTDPTEMAGLVSRSCRSTAVLLGGWCNPFQWQSRCFTMKQALKIQLSIGTSMSLGSSPEKTSPTVSISLITTTPWRYNKLHWEYLVCLSAQGSSRKRKCVWNHGPGLANVYLCWWTKGFETILKFCTIICFLWSAASHQQLPRCALPSFGKEGKGPPCWLQFE